ncbi:MAG: DNA-protecting protein DprA, partial [Nitrospirales bacterium]|nr:DNA-protecting protein DprA [Nitrospirales bacterium]
MHDTASLPSWLLLRGVRGLGDATYFRLVQTFGSPAAVLRASREELLTVGQVKSSLAQAICQGPDDEAKRAVDEELKSLEALGIAVIALSDPEYPSRLKTIHDPPPVLYVSGALSPADQHAIAIVGSRKATAAGRVFTEQLSRELASLGFTIVSGLARGVDAAAHRGALAAKGRTVAVLGCGLDRTYPPEHQALRRQVESSGAVIAELPLGSSPHGYHFPRRNRLISGMCLGVVVTEAALESGSLITARLAAEQGREVFAVPGFVKADTSRGPNALIKQGAKLVEGVEDILPELLPQLESGFLAHLTSCMTP